jgi:hypothetical protein
VQQSLTVELPEEGVIEGTKAAAQRWGASQGSGGTADAGYSHYVGFMGELALAKVLGVSVAEFAAGGDGGDDFIFNGHRIDIKTRTKAKYELLVYKHRLERDVLYVHALWLEQSRTVILRGWATAEDMLEFQPIFLPGNSWPRLRRHNGKLRPMDELLELLKVPADPSREGSS